MWATPDRGEPAGDRDVRPGRTSGEAAGQRQGDRDVDRRVRREGQQEGACPVHDQAGDEPGQDHADQDERPAGGDVAALVRAPEEEGLGEDGATPSDAGASQRWTAPR